MTVRLHDKTCFVTGGAQGIGRAIAERFALEGATVIAADLRFGADVPETAGITLLQLDVTNPEAVASAAAAHPEVSVLVNCVGYVATGNLLDCSLAEFDRSMDINVRSMVLTTRAFLPGMLTRGRGSIINIASVVSTVMTAPDRFAYATSKAAVIGLTSSIARDFVTRGIRCNAISPGTVDSPSLHQRFAATGDVAAARSAFVARQPMGRLGQPEEIAATAVLLGSDEATFMTGSNIIIDGGMSL
ncbi:SDR family oxidoreductase [Telluria mixta]|uniref:SDR family oxidoreductase n=1 Tax=Telluria mixta TaxID=34071 RepID=A0ABT2BYL0_9BURK|nr:SDR family oxidoreductase [Telluria mixta]MCS0630219.1 SDR family oxidoreductase [Telluria mixta]WEM94473.1 SDR family oxidoreductase [Telluria mixta]